jgi:uncharacterized membrane protein (DUF373 family)
MNKILNDTLKGPSGKYSRKSLTMFVSFIISIILGTYIVFSDKILNKEINKYSIDVFYGFLMLTGGLSGVTVWDKFKNKNNEEE